MESIASVLEGMLGSLPSLRGFMLRVAPFLLGVAGVLFALRRTGPLVAVRRAADDLLGGLVAVLLLVMVFLSGLQILLRNVFDTGLLWIDPLLRHLVLLLAYTGALVATGLKRHIQIDVLGRLLRGRAQAIGGALVAAASGTICLALAHASLEFLRDEIAFPEVQFLSVPSWVIAGIFPVSFVALTFRFYYVMLLELAGEAPGSGPPDVVGTAGEEGLRPGEALP